MGASKGPDQSVLGLGCSERFLQVAVERVALDALKDVRAGLCVLRCVTVHWPDQHPLVLKPGYGEIAELHCAKQFLDFQRKLTAANQL